MKMKGLFIMFLLIGLNARAFDYNVTPTSKSMQVNVLKPGSVMGEWDNYAVAFLVEREGKLICVGKQSALGVPRRDTIKVTVFGDDGINPGMYEGEEFKVVYRLGAPNACEVFVYPDFQGAIQTTYSTNTSIQFNWFTYNQAFINYTEDTICESSLKEFNPAWNTVPSYFGYQYSSANNILDVDPTTGAFKTKPGFTGTDTIRLNLRNTNEACNLENAFKVITVEQNQKFDISDYLTDKNDQDCDGFGQIDLDFSDYPIGIDAVYANGDKKPLEDDISSFEAPYDSYQIDLIDTNTCKHEATDKIDVAFIGNCEEELILMSFNGGPTSIYFENNEILSIYDKRGNLINEYQGPGYWDGKDKNGNPLSIGLYLIVDKNGVAKKLKVYQ